MFLQYDKFEYPNNMILFVIKLYANNNIYNDGSSNAVVNIEIFGLVSKRGVISPALPR